MKSVNPSIILIYRKESSLKTLYQFCIKYNIPLVVMNLTDEKLYLESGICITYLTLKASEGTTISSAINKAVYHTLTNFLLITEDQINLIEDFFTYSKVLANSPKNAAIHLTKSVSGTNQVQWIPILGSFYSKRGFSVVGNLDSSIRDISAVALEWSERARKSGWAFTLSDQGNEKGIDLSLIEEPLKKKKEKEFRESNPWGHKVTVIIPNYEYPIKALKAVTDLWRGQSIQPYIQIIDNSASNEYRNNLRVLENNQIEIFNMPQHKTKGPYDIINNSLDLGILTCRTPYAIITHNDLFPINRTLLEEMISQCDQNQPVVGYSSAEHNITYLLTTLEVSFIRNSKIQFSKPNSHKEKPQDYFNSQIHNSHVKVRSLGNEDISKYQMTPHFEHVGGYTLNKKLNLMEQDRSNSDLQRLVTEAELRKYKWNGM
jgi:hypothetical protein